MIKVQVQVKVTFWAVALDFQLSSNHSIMNDLDDEIESILYIAREVSGYSELYFEWASSDEAYGSV
jgi:hypothetical protein